MKKTNYAYLMGLVSIMALTSCGNAGTVDLDNIVFKSDNLVQSSYGGLGVEMGVYEDTDRLSPSSQERIIANMQKLN
ncbi:MAG: hypothetical protein RBR44_05350, partial [Bacilli bacterium]|nr:hypothetical protein [Bacilli bacterium]